MTSITVRDVSAENSPIMFIFTLGAMMGAFYAFSMNLNNYPGSLLKCVFSTVVAALVFGVLSTFIYHVGVNLQIFAPIKVI